MHVIATLEQLINEFRRLLPGETHTAQAIDRGEPWEQIAIIAVNDGYIELANELGRRIEACFRQSS